MSVTNGMPKTEQLAEALLRLRQVCDDLPVLAIHWMHVKHRVQTIQDELIRSNGHSSDELMRAASGREGWRRAGCAARGLGYALYVTVRLAWLRLHLWPALAALKRQSFALIAEGWRFSTTPQTARDDFYYSDLQQRLQHRGVQTLLLWKDPDGWGWRMAAQAKHWAVSAQQLPLLALAPLSAPWRVVIRQFRASRRLWRAASTLTDPWLSHIARRASRECLSPRSMAPSLYYWVTRAAVRTWQPRGLATLYEGHGWEELAWWGAGAADPSCRTIGYQHTMVQHNYKMLRSSQDGALPRRPHIVLCSGPQAQALLAPSHPQSTLIPFGTFRRFTDQGCVPPAPARRTILVLPEGHEDEAILLFQTALEIARDLPDHHVVLRSHPSLPFEMVQPYLTINPTAVPNVEVSSNPSISADFARSSVLLYRGSSSVFYAVLQGLKPLYVHVKGRHDIDPLTTMDGWRERVGSMDQLRAVVRTYAQSDPSVAAQAWKPTADYADGYIVPVSDQSIDRLLEALNRP